MFNIVLRLLALSFLCSLTLVLAALYYLQDPRLLGEIHIALLRSIIKDIEDVARTPSTGLGTNPNCAANPGGGHPQIVQGVSFVL